MIILEERNSQMVPSALSKRMTEKRKKKNERISFAFSTLRKSPKSSPDRNDQPDSFPLLIPKVGELEMK